MASNSILSQLCRQDVQNPGVIRAASCWKGESLPCCSQRLLAILSHHWLVDASPRLCLQLPMRPYTLSLGLQISLFLVELWLICIVVWQKPSQHCKAIFLQLKKFFKRDCDKIHIKFTILTFKMCNSVAFRTFPRKSCFCYTSPLRPGFFSPPCMESTKESGIFP